MPMSMSIPCMPLPSPPGPVAMSPCPISPHFLGQILLAALPTPFLRLLLRWIHASFSQVVPSDTSRACSSCLIYASRVGDSTVRCEQPSSSHASLINSPSTLSLDRIRFLADPPTLYANIFVAFNSLSSPRRLRPRATKYFFKWDILRTPKRRLDPSSLCDWCTPCGPVIIVIIDIPHH